MSDLKEKVIWILNQTKDEPCWLDWGRIYKDLAELCDIKDYSPNILPKNIMLKNCEHFIECMERESKYEVPDIISLLEHIYLHLTLPYPEEEIIERQKLIEQLKKVIKYYEHTF